MPETSVEGKVVLPKTPRLRLEPLPIDTSAHKFDLIPSPPPAPEPPPYEYLGELPECYGTGKLFLTARDSHWLFAYWDFSWEQIADFESAAHDHKVFLQLYHENDHRVQQIQVYPGTRDWHLNANQADTTFYAELGYYRADGGFEVVSRSGHTTTPREGMSGRTDGKFVTIPFHFTFRELMELIDGHVLPGEELAEALARLEAEGFPLPFETFVMKMLSEKGHHDLLQYLQGDLVRRMQMGSMEIFEILRRHLADLRSSGQWMTSPGVSSWSSPMGASFGAQQERGFFMNVNAELIIYGGTDPKAKVRIDNQEIPLRPDGTFSYHFNFKDGNYHIPITAESPDKVETRSAMLSFMRVTETSGGVDETPQLPRPEPFGRKK